MDEASSVDSNIKASSVDELELGLTEKQIEDLQNGSDFAYQQRLISGHPNMRSLINLKYLKEAIKELRTSPPDFSIVKVID